jgi:hypothetical protein
VLQPADLIFNQMPFFIQMLINLSLLFVIGARRNDGFRVSLFQLQDERFRVITFVGDHVIGREIFDERLSLRDVVAFATPSG